ncbi:hypothetical protein Goshw_018841 [Gossypium schwendimanii]|uniref:Uncharacterized protein n=1 Tax=Gossypium schwendimanii TaxID=34291 RepID=A0A7J9MEE7_GOSSC|nr:hypothetical protein [Gossypium schwendimanii]
MGGKTQGSLCSEQFNEF